MREQNRNRYQRVSWHSVGAAQLWAQILHVRSILRLQAVQKLSAWAAVLEAENDVRASAVFVLLIRQEGFKTVGDFRPGIFSAGKTLSFETAAKMPVGDFA